MGPVCHPAPSMPSPGLYPTVTVQLPLWPGLSGAAAVGPVLDPSAVPHAAASLGGGGGAALYAMPTRDGVGARPSDQPSNRPTVQASIPGPSVCTTRFLLNLWLDRGKYDEYVLFIGHER